MSKSPWGVGAWAAEAEREEAEEREAAAKAAANAATQPATSFPSLKESVSTSKQKKKTKMALHEFMMQQSPSSAPGRGLTPEEMLHLPTGPKERSPDEMQYGRLGGGFSNYGSRGGSGGSNTGRPREYEGRRSYGFEDDGRQQSRVPELDQPSRADEVDNWASMKKQTPPANYDSREARPGGKYSSLGGASRADEVDNWASMKKPISQPQPQGRSSSFGSGYSRPDSDRWTRNENFGSGFSRPEPNRWTRSEQTPNLSLSSPNAEVAEGVKVNKPNPFGAARPREDVLAEKGLDWKKLDLEIAEKKHVSGGGGSRPTSSHSNRPETPQSSRSEASPAFAGTGEVASKQRPKVNPFGDAKPREVLLEEKGLDWKKIDLNLDRRADRSETAEEKNLKEEIEKLKKEMLLKSGEEQAGVQDLIHKKEQDLEILTHQLDDEVRYNQRNFDRQNPGSVRGSGFNDRPPSQPGVYEDPRPGFQDHPPSPGVYEEPRAGYQERPPSRLGANEDSRAGFSERPPSRPGAYEDRQSGNYERPRSRSGAYENNRSSYPQRSSLTDGAQQEARGLDANERTRSRGSGNSWTRPRDDRRYFQGSGGRGFSGSRDVDRSGSRW